MRKLLVAAAIFAGALGVSAAQADTVGAVAGAGTGPLPGLPARWSAVWLGRFGGSRSGDLQSARVIAGPIAISAVIAATPGTGELKRSIARLP